MNGNDVIRAIRRLPLKVSIYSDIGEAYVKERKQIRTPKQLRQFTRKWQAIWQIPWVKNWAPDRTERQIVSGRYDPKQVLKCISKNVVGQNGCIHVHRDIDCVSAHILAPAMLIRLLEIKTHYGVSEGVALLQLQRALHEDLRYIDPEKIVGYHTVEERCRARSEPHVISKGGDEEARIYWENRNKLRPKR